MSLTSIQQTQQQVVTNPKDNNIKQQQSGLESTIWLNPLEKHVELDQQQIPIPNDIIEKFSSQEKVEQLITKAACRTKTNLENIPSKEGRYCTHHFAKDDITITVFYYHHNEFYYVVGVKFLNHNVQKNKIENIEFVICNPSEVSEFRNEREYEYIYQVIMNGKFYDLNVNSLGMCHFEQVSKLETEKELEQEGYEDESESSDHLEFTHSY
ncbi:hypothetical protein ABK040_003909 [Willaertia magna]